MIRKKSGTYCNESLSGYRVALRNLKQLGDRLYSREFDRQVVESHIRAAIINTFTYLGMPQSIRVVQIAPVG